MQRIRRGIELRPADDTARSKSANSEADQRKGSAKDPDLAGELLECVVRETMSAVNDDATIEKIKSFVHRNQRRHVTDPEVAEELISIIVKSRFGKLTLPSELPRWIAETLLDDPTSSERLQAVWTQAQMSPP